MTVPVPVSIEFAHTMLGGDAPSAEAISELRASAEIALRLQRELSARGVGSRTVILWDDKLMSPALDRATEARRLQKLIGADADFQVFESDLSQMAGALVAAIPEPRRSNLETNLARRAAKGSVMTCSVDIAIWHLLRLGVLRLPSDAERSLRQPPGFIGPYDVAVSILSRGLKSSEDASRRGPLSDFPQVVHDRIVVSYVRPDETEQRVLRHATELANVVEGRFHGNRLDH